MKKLVNILLLLSASLYALAEGGKSQVPLADPYILLEGEKYWRSSIYNSRYPGQEITKELVAKDNGYSSYEELLQNVYTKKGYASLNEIDSKEAFADIFSAIPKITQKLGIKEYRTVVNTGASAGQTVFHIHVHVMAGREFRWPAG